MATVDTAELTAWICDLVPAWSPADIGGFYYLEGGYNNRNFRFRHQRGQFVLRVPGADSGFTDRQLEAEFYRQSSMNGAPLTPIVCGYCSKTGRMISEWVAGHLLADLSVGREQLALMLRQLHVELARLLVRLAHIPIRRYDPVQYARGVLANSDAPRWLLDRAAVMEWSPSRSVLCHNDLNPWNLILDNQGRWVTLDWEWLAFNDPLFDVVALHQGAGWQTAPSADIQSLQTFAETCMGESIPATRIRECRSAFWLRETAWAAAAIARGERRAEISAQYALGCEWLRIPDH